MRVKARVLFLPLSILLGVGSLAAVDFSVRAYSSWSWVNGGDLNASISGWRRYYRDRQSIDDEFTFGHDLAELHGATEAGGEVVFRLTPRWSVGLGAGFLHQKRVGEISTNLITGEYIPLSPTEWIRTDFIEESHQFPILVRETIPITLTLDYRIAFGRTYELNLGIGAGIYINSYSYEEDYTYALYYTEYRHSGDSLVWYADWYETRGQYTENMTNKTLGLHGRLGLHVRLVSSLFLSLELLGRWVSAKNWEGNKADTYTWWHSWGPWGTYSDNGEGEESSDGKLWRVDVRSDQTGNIYPRLVCSEEEPVSSSYTRVSPADINLSGYSIRIGLGIRFGRKD